MSHGNGTDKLNGAGRSIGSPAPHGREKRVFWLGMHVVLTRTELPMLRDLGYEVFSPPYNSDIYDQSANLDWDKDQVSTLPREVFDKLSRYNFFYNPLSPDIAELLNAFFGTIIVTINPDWLVEVLKVFKGRIIYRVYGQPFSLSDHFWSKGVFRLIDEHPDFHFVPHHEEAVSQEHAWLKERMRVVPYNLPFDFFKYRDTWGKEEVRRKIMVSCPNITNPYYANHYNHLRVHYPEPYIEIYGKQRSRSSDPRVMGTLSFQEMIKAYQTAGGYFYPYHERQVCYLPPIEMMTVGGPVIFMKDSLIDHYFKGGPPPGRANDMEEVKAKMNLLLRRDESFISEVIASQKEVRELYSVEHVAPRFKDVFGGILGAPPVLERKSALMEKPVSKGRRTVYLLFHFQGGIVGFKDGRYVAVEGIPRVMRRLVHAILRTTDLDVCITCDQANFVNTLGFFSLPGYRDRLRFLVRDAPGLAGQRGGPLGGGRLRRISESLALFVNRQWGRVLAARGRLEAWLARSMESPLNMTPEWLLSIETGLPFQVNKWMFRAARLFHLLFICAVVGGGGSLLLIIAVPLWGLRWGGIALRKAVLYLLKAVRRLPALLHAGRKFDYMRTINEDANAHSVLVPHYFAFPEAVFVKPPLHLYLPDFIPHFFSEDFSSSQDRRDMRIGRSIASRAVRVLTNSRFTRDYLSGTALQVGRDKISVLPLPLLMSPAGGKDEAASVARKGRFPGRSRYLFYPTQNRPNKRLDFALRVFNELHKKQGDLRLVLTCSINDHAPASAAYHKLRLEDAVDFRPGLTDEELHEYYENAAALLFTSTFEGNFPPQVFEALTAGTPVVASDIPVIREVLEDATDSLAIAAPLDLKDFVDKTERVLRAPKEARERQSRALRVVLAKADESRFTEAVSRLYQGTGADGLCPGVPVPAAHRPLVFGGGPQP